MNSRKRLPSGMMVLFVSLVLILALAGCENGNLGLRGGSISGVVIDSRTLAGVQSVNVTAVTGTGNESVSKYILTDSQGGYHIGDMRAGEWILSFDKVGYNPITQTDPLAPKVVAVNNEHRSAPEVRLVQQFVNQYINIKGTLKDSRNGTLIQAGTAQFVFGTQSFSNRLPTEFQTGFSVAAVNGEMNVSIQVTGYQAYTTVISNAVTDKDMGIVLLQPQTYSIVGSWHDVPAWVLEDNPTASIFAYSGNKLVATASSQMDSQSFQLSGIPMGISVSIEASVKGYRMNGAIPVVPNSDFQGTIYQTLSLKTNFSQILRDVRVIVSGTSIDNGDRVGAYCKESGTVWPTTIVSGTGWLGTGNPRVIDLGVNQVPTGYRFTFTGFNVENGSTSDSSNLISDDGSDPQIVTIQVN